MTPAPVKPLVTSADLDKLDIRVGTIRGVGEVPGSRKLLKLQVDFGDHDRQILAGLKVERPDAGQLIGVQALFVVNLAPRQMAGEVSEGHAVRPRLRRRAHARFCGAGTPGAARNSGGLKNPATAQIVATHGREGPYAAGATTGPEEAWSGGDQTKYNDTCERKLNRAATAEGQA